MTSFSVITPTLHNSHYVTEAIESVSRQHNLAAPTEHILVLPSDDTRGFEVAEIRPSPRILYRPRQGPADAFNRGLWQAQGELIGCLSDDDLYYPETLSKVSQLFADRPDVDLIYGGVAVIDEQSVPYRRRRAKRLSRKTLARRDIVSASSLFFRREVLRKVGPLDTSLQYLYWYDFVLRALLKGLKAHPIYDTLAGQRRHRGNRQFGSADLNLHYSRTRELVNLLEKRLGSVPASAALKLGHCKALESGLDQTMGGYDRIVLTEARTSQKSTSRRRQTSRLVDDAALLLAHVRNQISHAIRYPHDATRFLPKRMRPGFRAFCRSRLFQLRQHAPRESNLLSAPSTASIAEPLSIGIVTPNLNAAPTLRRTITSVLDQNYPALEYVIQDGQSSDGSLDIIRQYSDRLHHWDSSPDTGQAVAINRGMQYLHADVLAYLNSDDVLLPNSLAYVSEFFRSRPDVDVIYGHRLIIDADDREVGRWILPKHDDKAITYADYIPQETMFWRRRAWESVGSRLDESFQFALDWDLILRFRSAGLRFERVPRFLGAFRLLDTQKTQVMLATLGETEMNRLRRRELGRVPTPREKHRQMRSYRWRQWVRHHAYSFWEEAK